MPICTLQWTDAFQPDRGDGRSDVAFEKAALIFNLGAISSQVWCQWQQGMVLCNAPGLPPGMATCLLGTAAHKQRHGTHTVLWGLCHCTAG